MNISTRRLLTSITREIGGFLFTKNFFKKFWKNTPKNALPVQTSEGVNSEPRKWKPFICILCILKTEYRYLYDLFKLNFIYTNIKRTKNSTVN